MIKNPKIEPIGKDRYRLLKAYVYTTDKGGVIAVPKGYLTNGADIPRLFWRLYPPFSPEYLPAVIVHDYLCDEADAMIDKACRKRAFLFADDVFREILFKLGVSRLKTTIFYKAVRLWHTIK